jgi:hypothetical protein
MRRHHAGCSGTPPIRELVGASLIDNPAINAMVQPGQFGSAENFALNEHQTIGFRIE